MFRNGRKEHRGEGLSAAGLEEISVEPTRIYRVEEAREFLTSAGIDHRLSRPHHPARVKAHQKSARPSAINSSETRVS
jgi:hypothetical protein